MRRALTAALASAAFLHSAGQAEAGMFDWVHGDWYLTLGAAGIGAAKFEGADGMAFSVSPIISLGKVGPEARFVSRNDNISLSLYDGGAFRAGIAGKFILGRDSDDFDELKGARDVRFGGEAGGFAEVYPTEWLRLRGEVRHGIRSHDGVVADLSADAFYDITDTVRVSGGPRLSAATRDYFDAYYGVDATEAAASGLSAFDPKGGLKSIGVGGAVTWKTTENLTTSIFAEYSRLQGSAAGSSIVKERGSPNQFMIGVSAAYKFNFSL